MFDYSGPKAGKAAMVGRLAVIALLAGFAVVIASPSAPAQESSSAFQAVASADGVRLQYTVPGFILVEKFVDAGGPVAQSELATGDVVRAFASNPYPGDTVVAAGGVIAFGTGLPAPPDYPLYVSADHPFKPEQTSQDASGSYRLTAKADSTEGNALAAVGPDESGVLGRAITSIADDGTVTALAETVNKGVSLGADVLEIASVTSRSVTTLAPGAGEPKTVTELVIDGASIMGTPVGITPEGVRIGTSSIPLGVAEQLAPLNAALQQAGLTIQVVDGAEMEGGGSADVLQITQVGAVPVPGSPTGTLIYRVGGATSFINVGEGAGAAPIVQDSFDPGTPSVAGDVAVAPADLGLPTADLSAFSPGSPPRVSVTPASDVSQVLVPRDLRAAVRFFYIVIMVGGALLGVALALWRSKGVHVPWTTSSPG